MKEIALTQGYVTLVDDDDWEWLNQWKWHVIIRTRTSYAARNPGRRGGHGTTIMMHRAIFGTAPLVLTDHINGDGLDNRRVNLRECTRTENNRNRRSLLRSTSNYKGVSWIKARQKWQAQIEVDGRNRFLGHFQIEAEAADAYKAAAEIVHGAFAAGARGDG